MNKIKCHTRGCTETENLTRVLAYYSGRTPVYAHRCLECERKRWNGTVIIDDPHKVDIEKLDKQEFKEMWRLYREATTVAQVIHSEDPTQKILDKFKRKTIDE